MIYRLDSYLKLALLLCTVKNTHSQFVEGFLSHIAGISYRDCIIMCEERLESVSVTYQRKFHLCTLWDIEKSSTDTGTYIHTKSKSMQNAHKAKYAQCRAEDWDVDQTCKPVSCSVPKTFPGARVFGNKLQPGSKVKHACVDGSSFVIGECLSTGQWSSVTLACKCSDPIVDKAAFALTKLNNTHVKAAVTCNPGFKLYQTNDLVCDIQNGVWENENNAFCQRMFEDPWWLIYNLPGNIPVDITKHYTDSTQPTYGMFGQFRNGSIIDNWHYSKIRRVKVQIYREENVVAYINFAANGTTDKNWFSVANILESSWSDLSGSTPVSAFDFFGLSQGSRRWFISNSYTDECEATDTGWLVLTWDHYDCFNRLYEHIVILYSDDDKAERFVDMPEADSFTIWVEFD